MMLPRVERIEFNHLYPGRAQLLEEGGVGADGTDAVVDDVNMNTGLALLYEEIAQHLPVAAHVLENIVLEVYIPFGRADGGEHGGEGFGTVAQDVDLVADEERALSDDLLDRK